MAHFLPIDNFPHERDSECRCGPIRRGDDWYHNSVITDHRRLLEGRKRKLYCREESSGFRKTKVNTIFVNVRGFDEAPEWIDIGTYDNESVVFEASTDETPVNIDFAEAKEFVMFVDDPFEDAPDTEDHRRAFMEWIKKAL